MLILHDRRADSSVLLEKRPPTGIWGGLWSLPEYPWEDADEQRLHQWCREQFHSEAHINERWPAIKHSFTHFQLTIHPFIVHCEQAPPAAIMEDDRHLWYNSGQILKQALATPARRLLERFIASQGEIG